MEPTAAEVIAALYATLFSGEMLYWKGMRYRYYATPCFSSFEHFVEDIKLGSGSPKTLLGWKRFPMSFTVLNSINMISNINRVLIRVLLQK